MKWFYFTHFFGLLNNLTVQHLSILSGSRRSWLASACEALSSVVIGLLSVAAHLLMALEVSDDFIQHVNEAAESVRDSCIQLVVLTEVI